MAIYGIISEVNFIDKTCLKVFYEHKSNFFCIFQAHPDLDWLGFCFVLFAGVKIYVNTKGSELQHPMLGVEKGLEVRVERVGVIGCYRDRRLGFNLCVVPSLWRLHQQNRYLLDRHFSPF